MTSPFVSRVGGTLSADIAVPEHELEARFYARVLGTGRPPLWGEDLKNSHGVPVIGLGVRGPDHAILPLQWMPHIQVEDVGASVARATAQGGRELMHGKNPEGLSQWAVLQDPNGAAFGLIPVVPEEMLPPQDEGDGAPAMGCIQDISLTVPDANSTCDFYREVVGFGVKALEREDADGRFTEHQMLGSDGKPAAHICAERSPHPVLPRVWMLHLPVGDLVESVRRVRAGNGEVLHSVVAEDNRVVGAFIRDPVGVCVALVEGYSQDRLA